ncbi:unnamed protein product [Phytophthora fragariaefolia]|uniref:Unnamed protein product n=1 Tax=Phytophthora fragariaefolia TaxID=1490495 RepID=A0A9W6X9P6_9STRA|nr:unnamed protein product [Phytophthora fragariaefolia]
MTDSALLDPALFDVFLGRLDEPALSGNELIQSLDKNETPVQVQGPELALEMLDVSAFDDLFSTPEDSSLGSRDLHSDSTCVESESVASAPSPQLEMENIRSRDAIRRSAYRQKQKAQKEALRRQVEELSGQLTALQKSKEEAGLSHGGRDHAAVWKALAERHMQARVMAEEYRTRLRAAVEKRETLIRDLGVLIRKRVSEELSEEPVRAAKKPCTESPDMALYEAFINELDEIYARTDTVFEKTAVKADMESCEDAQVFYIPSQTAKPDARYHELVGTMSMPFEFERTRPLLHKVCLMGHSLGLEMVTGSWIPEHTDISKKRTEGPGFNALVQHCILRRYYESGRVVVVWRKFTEGEGTFMGMHYSETGWAIVRPSPTSQQGTAGILLESVIRFAPINFSTAEASDLAVKQFTDTVIKTGEDICQAYLQKLEQVLLDDALGVC